MHAHLQNESDLADFVQLTFQNPQITKTSLLLISVHFYYSHKLLVYQEPLHQRHLHDFCYSFNVDVIDLHCMYLSDFVQLVSTTLQRERTFKGKLHVALLAPSHLTAVVVNLNSQQLE